MRGKEFQFARETAEEASQFLLSRFGKNRDSIRGTGKGIKIAEDGQVDRLIINSIQKNYPGHAILTEESGLVCDHSDYLWIVDPIDGTRNFENHNPFFAVSIALWFKKRPVLGVIMAPVLRECYCVRAGKGAWVEDLDKKRKKRAKVSEISRIEDAYGLYCWGGAKDADRVWNLIRSYWGKSKDMRKLGSASIECVWVGLGRAEFYMTPEISFWDIAAGVLFVEEAGGRVLDFNFKKQKWNSWFKGYEGNLCVKNKDLKMIDIKY